MNHIFYVKKPHVARKPQFGHPSNITSVANDSCEKSIALKTECTLFLKFAEPFPIQKKKKN